MKSLLIFAIIVVTFVATTTSVNPYKTVRPNAQNFANLLLAPVFEVCADDMGAPRNSTQLFIERKTDITDEYVKCTYACILHRLRITDKTGYMSGQGVIDFYVTTYEENPWKIYSAMSKCEFVQGNDFCDNGLKIYTCLVENDL